MSKIAAKNPRAYGNVLILTSPLFAAAAGPKTKMEFIVGTLFLAGLGAYNLSIEDEGESVIFRNNMIIYNAIFLPAIGYVLYNESRAEPRPAAEVSPAVIPDGAIVFVGLRF